MDGDRDLIGKNIKIDLYRQITTTDVGWNVDEQSWPALPTHANVRARISTLRAEQKEHLRAIGINISTIAAHGIFFDAGEDVLIGDHVKHGGEFYEIVSIENVDKDDVHMEGIIVLWKGVIV